jgi:hypothetical protein
VALLCAAMLSAGTDHWFAAVGFGIALGLYLLAVRRVRCRVETREGRPCSWSARGFVGSCKSHVGLKRGLPRVIRFSTLGRPRFMWRRLDLPSAPQRRARPVAAMREVGMTTLPERDGRETVMLWLAVGGVVVALLSFLRDLVAG